MKKIVLSLVFSLSLFAMTGKQLYENGLEYVKLQNGLKYNKVKLSIFISYINGFVDTLSDKIVCIPYDANKKVWDDIFYSVINELKEKAEFRNQNATTALLYVLVLKYPCKHSFETMECMIKYKDN